jgi:CRISPR-associated protein Cas1
MLDITAIFSLDSLRLAWDKIRRNKGCAGVDGETIARFGQNTDRNLMTLHKHLLSGTYRPMPLRRFVIPKTNGKQRVLGVPTVRDRIVQQALLMALHPVLEPQFETCSFAYRPGRSHKTAVQQIRYWHHCGYDWVMDADIVQYFDNIQHNRLFAEIEERIHPNVLQRLSPRLGEGFRATSPIFALLEAWVSAGVMTHDGIIFPEKGVPQGSVVSPILSNIYLDDFDEIVMASNVKLVRYADDFVILAKRESDIYRAQEQVADLLQSMDLQLHPEKTQITTFDRGFRFLGHVFVRDVIVPTYKPKRQSHSPKSTIEPEPLDRLIYADSNLQPTQMQQALTEALRETQQPIPPPLYVVLGYQVRPWKSVAITSNEWEWKPGMSTLYLVQQGTTVTKEQGRFLVKSPQAKTVEIPIREVQQILVFGNIQLTTAVISSCLDHQVPVLFLSQLGDYKGHLWSAEYDEIQTEMVQYQRQMDAAFKLATAQAIVVGKLLNSKQLLLRLNRKRRCSEVAGAIAGLTEDIAAAQQTTSIEALRGYEGVAAARYFKALGQLIVNEAFTFTERNRRPPKDPVNSLLSFGYTLLFNNVLSLILAEGLNPYLGNLHGSEKKKTFLAFDLVEEFRSPVVDSLVMRLINQKFFKPTDFTWPNEDSGIFLNDTTRRPFLAQFEKRLSLEISHPDVQSPVSYRRAIQLQVRRYKQALLGHAPYAAYRKEN